MGKRSSKGQKIKIKWAQNQNCLFLVCNFYSKFYLSSSFCIILEIFKTIHETAYLKCENYQRGKNHPKDRKSKSNWHKIRIV